MQSIREGDTESYIDKYVAESFSIGITLLEAGIMQDISPVYNQYTFVFDENRLEIYLKDWWNLVYQKSD